MDEHSLHSPSVYALYTQRLKRKHRTRVIIPEVESLRQTFKKSQRKIDLKNMGAASGLTKPRLVSRIADRSAPSRQQSEILYHLIAATQAKQVLELGSSLGINTLYMSRMNSLASVVTIEGNNELAPLAQQHFSQLGATNITLKNKDIDEALGELLAQNAVFDFVYIDASRTAYATLRYFMKIRALLSLKAIVALGDISRSMETARAWRSIKKNAAQLCIENYATGFVILGTEAAPTSYVLAF